MVIQSKKRPTNKIVATRKPKKTVFCSIEGHTEKHLLNYLKELYPDTTVSPENPLKAGGGCSPDRIVNIALEKCNDDIYSQVFSWIDEDKDLSRKCRKNLAEHWGINKKLLKSFLNCPLKNLQKNYNPNLKNPVLIVSQPVSVESLILKILGKDLPFTLFEHSKRDEQIKTLKNTLKGIFGKTSPIEYYRLNLSKKKLEERRKTIPELELLIRMIGA